MSIYTNTDEHQTLVTLYKECGGDLQKVAAALNEDEQWLPYRVDTAKLRQKFPKDATIFACHMIRGDFGKCDPDVCSEENLHESKLLC